MEEYEYKIVTYDTKGFWGGTVDAIQLQDELNALGNDGWELVNGFSTTQNQGATKSIVCLLKRKKS